MPNDWTNGIPEGVKGPFVAQLRDVLGRLQSVMARGGTRAWRTTQGMMPTATNPSLKRWQDAAGSEVKDAGGSDAASAVAGQRAWNQGIMKLGDIATPQYQRLQNVLLDLTRKRDALPHVTDDLTAFTSGFFSGGGGQGLGSMFGGGKSGGGIF